MSEPQIREYAAMLSDALLPYQASVPDDLKVNVQELVKTFTQSQSDLFSLGSRRTLLYLLAFADDETRKQIFNLSYLYFGSADTALTVFYEDVLIEMKTGAIVESEEKTKSLLLTVAALDKEAKNRQLINLMSIVADTTRGYMKALESIYKRPVSTKKRDFRDAS